MDKEITDFGNKIIQDTYQKWLIYENQYKIWNYGFGVFYSPIYYQPDLMLIGYNVGGSEKDFSLQECLVIPDEHEYFLYNYKLARIQKNIWDNLNGVEVLRSSIKLNLNFFRSKSIAQWKTIPKSIRLDLENFSINIVKEIISNLEPKIIIAEGIATYDELLWKVFGIESSLSSKCEKRNKRRIFIDTLHYDRNILGIAHPSGCRLNNEDIQLIISNLKNYF